MCIQTYIYYFVLIRRIFYYILKLQNVQYTKHLHIKSPAPFQPKNPWSWWWVHLRVTVHKWSIEKSPVLYEHTHRVNWSRTVLNWPCLILFMHALLGTWCRCVPSSLWQCICYKTRPAQIYHVTVSVWFQSFRSHSLFTTLWSRLTWSETVLAAQEHHPHSPCWDSYLLCDLGFACCWWTMASQ